MNSTISDPIQHLNNSKGVLSKESISTASNSNASSLNSTIESFASSTVEQVSDNKSLTDRKFKITLGNGEIINIRYELARSNYSPNNTEIQDAKTHNATIYGFDVTNTISNATNRVNSTMIYYVPYEKLPVEVVTALENNQLTKPSSQSSAFPVSLNKFSEFTLNPTSVSAVFNPASAIRNNLIYVQENPGTSSEPPSQPLTNKEGWALFKLIYDYSTDTLDVFEVVEKLAKIGSEIPGEGMLGDIAGEAMLVGDFILTIPDLLMLVNDANKDIAELDRFLELVNNPDCNIDAKTIQQLSDKIKALQLDTKTLGTMLGLYALVSIPAPPFLGQVLDIALDDVKESLRELYQQEIELLKKFETPNRYKGTLQVDGKTTSGGGAWTDKHNDEFTFSINPGDAAVLTATGPILSIRGEGKGTVDASIDFVSKKVTASESITITGEYDPNSKLAKLKVEGSPTGFDVGPVVIAKSSIPMGVPNVLYHYASSGKYFTIDLSKLDKLGSLTLQNSVPVQLDWEGEWQSSMTYELIVQSLCHLPKAPSEPDFEPKKDISRLSPVKPTPTNQPPKLPEYQPPVNTESQTPINPTPDNQPQQLPKFQPPLNPSQKDPHPKLPQFPTIP